MPQDQLPAVFHRMLAEADALGSFSLNAWSISLSGPCPPTPEDLDEEARDTLSHEFGHFLHYFTTYAGLLDLRAWARALAVLVEGPRAGESPEQRVNRQAAAVLSINRAKQVLSIDDFYYFEPRWDRMQEALDEGPDNWSWGEVVGSLLRADGTTSPRKFWGLRFYLGPREDDRSFLRLPLGLRTILEHMAEGVDFTSTVLKGDDDAALAHLARTIEAAHDPERAHYYALTHRLSSVLGKLYSRSERQLTFQVSGQLMSVLADLPFDEPAVWSDLRAFAQQVDPQLAAHMEHPHPSFVYPLLLKAFESLAIPIDQLMDWAASEQTADELVGVMGLPDFHTLLLKRNALSEEVESILQAGDAVGERVALLRWARTYEQKLSRSQKYLAPLARLGEPLPMPLVFDGGATFPGTILGIEEYKKLLYFEKRYHEMLRYHAFRDIVE